MKRRLPTIEECLEVEEAEFVCMMNAITNTMKLSLDIDIISMIYDRFEESYDNYTLIELINLVGADKITCEWNKKAIIKMIKEKGLNIPPKREPMLPTEWEHYRVRKSLDVINANNIEFYDGSIIKNPFGDVLILETICRDLDEDNEEIFLMYFKNMQTDEEICINAEDFMWSMDNEDNTILQDRNYSKFMNEEQKQYWTNHIRWI